MDGRGVRTRAGKVGEGVRGGDAHAVAGWGEGFAATCVRDESEVVFAVVDAAAVRAGDGVGGTDATR